MISPIIIFVLIVVMVWLIFKLRAKDNRPELIEKQAGEKEQNKKAILGLLEKQTPLTNNQIEQLLGVSDATATRYLEELEKEGRIRQVGKTGQSVYYKKL